MAEQANPPSERPVVPDCPEISDRTLEQDIPELKEYLQSGAAVLDIGCGSGTITLDVAEAVSPGQVIGIDPKEKRINIAHEWLAQHPSISNASFQVVTAIVWITLMIHSILSTAILCCISF